MTSRRRCLELLSDGARWRGLDLVKASDGVLTRSRVYICLAALEDDGYVRSFAHGVVLGMQVLAYEITSAGRAALLRDNP